MVVAESWQPHVLVQKDPTTQLLTSYGPMGQVLETFAQSMNFTYTLVNGDGFWGGELPNGSWNGMMGYVIRGDAVMGLGPFSVSYHRSRVVDFTDPVFLEQTCVLVQRPRPKTNLLGFVAAFR